MDFLCALSLSDGKRILTRKKFLVVLLSIFLVFSFTACSTFQEVGPREEAARQYRYPGLRDELIVEAPKITPPIVNPGGTLTQELRVTLLSPQKEKAFKVMEVNTLSGEGLSLELHKKESAKSQGTYTSTIQIVLPGDLPQGQYTLITTVATEDQQVRQKGTFRVQKQDGR
jgi:hypothetical protein